MTISLICVSVLIFIIYILAKKEIKAWFKEISTKKVIKEKEVVKEPPPLPKHPYQSVVDTVSAELIRSIDFSLQNGFKSASVYDWKNYYQDSIKKEVVRVVTEHFKHHISMSLTFKEDSKKLTAEIHVK